MEIENTEDILPLSKHAKSKIPTPSKEKISNMNELREKLKINKKRKSKKRNRKLKGRKIEAKEKTESIDRNGNRVGNRVDDRVNHNDNVNNNGHDACTDSDGGSVTIWRTDASLCEFDVMVSVKMDPLEMIEIITEKNHINFRSLLMNYNKYLHKINLPAIRLRKITSEQVMDVIVHSICPGCLEDGCIAECLTCDRWYCGDCVPEPKDDWRCNFCLL